jgi:hypothetical protein
MEEFPKLVLRVFKYLWFPRGYKHNLGKPLSLERKESQISEFPKDSSICIPKYLQPSHSKKAQTTV